MAHPNRIWQPRGSSMILEAVEQWAKPECWTIRETEIGVCGRIDALLVPLSFDAPILKRRRGWSFDKCGLIGVEIKRDRGDFLKGLRGGQYERYDERLSGLYVATPKGLVQTSEIPEGIGHLIVWGQGGLRCACKRHPTFTDGQETTADLWRILFKLRAANRDALIKSREKSRLAAHRIGQKGERIIKMLLSSAESD